MERSDAVAGHEPVMLKEVLEYLSPRPGKAFLDLTLGGGGHAEAILKRLGSSGQLVGVDRDEEVLLATAARLRGQFDNVRCFSADFAQVRELSRELEGQEFDGILMDLGVSSMQLEDPARGFSFRLEGPLDMRMDRSTGATAREMLARSSQKELTEVIRDYGQERHAAGIARAIVRRRAKKPLQSTIELAAICKRVVGRAGGRIHPATRTFQALRIAVNDELRALEEALRFIPEMLKGGGVVVVISFHSLEDAIVKRSFRDWDREGVYEVVTPKPLRPTAQEVSRNRRSRSARLRAARRTEKLINSH